MPGLVRFGVSLAKDVLDRFDRHVRERKCPTRSKAIENLIRDALIAEAGHGDSTEIAGAITIVYDHHRRELVSRLLSLQHDYQGLIVSVQHVHLSHSQCLEIIVARGKAGMIRGLADLLKAEKGITHVSLTVSAVQQRGKKGEK